MSRVDLRRLPPGLALTAKRLASRPRYIWQRAQAGGGKARYGDRYKHDVVFIAGLPKSGSTWLKQMVCGFPGYHEVMPPEANRHELEHGESHSLKIEPGMIERLSGCLAVLKLHVGASEETVSALRHTGVPVIVLYRDVRDVCVSYVAYVSRTPWHPEHSAYRDLSMSDGIHRFAQTHLPAYVDWIVDWHAAAGPLGALELTYQSMLGDPLAAMRAVASHLDIEAPDSELDAIVQQNSFQAKTGRGRGAENRSAFRRKGIVGDWKNHFDEDATRLFSAAMAPLEPIGLGIEAAER